ncbi:ABC transporter ATP-binding protein [Corynebacterium liangguodongii]|uniref:Uncharacterized protein n=1 Tax=Corynebacterium liangguodongii TaxID=2079535 RepID=A0A2S0WEU1_9CORY|nr:ABC transporter ATP-binding protein [Corynebacterium liangguodongii]AWB84288.1 hypothetical protein C3E79_07175 [Corynebacterium liangguodongii]PWB98581.1 ABC transporter ATP-binding protein [Corynebacterium liangguodongii]
MTTMKENVLVTAANIDVRRGSRSVFQGASLELVAGNIYAIAGPNGAGKTTLLDVITGLLPPEKGDIYLLGRTPPLTDGDSLKEIKVLRQDGRPFSDLTVRDFISFVEQVDGVEIDVHRERFGLSTSLLDQKVSSLSGGEAKRLQLLTTVVSEPSVVILDEPTTGLDPTSREILWNEIRRLRDHGALILLVTHYLEEMESLADALIYIKAGKVHGPYPLSELKADFGYVITFDFTDEAAVSAFVTKLPSDAVYHEVRELTLRIDVRNSSEALAMVACVSGDSSARKLVQDFAVSTTTLATVLQKLEEAEEL